VLQKKIKDEGGDEGRDGELVKEDKERRLV
jgi:hypothetical protein